LISENTLLEHPFLIVDPFSNNRQKGLSNLPISMFFKMIDDNDRNGNDAKCVRKKFAVMK